MKIFLIDNCILIKRINRLLEEMTVEGIEVKDNCKFKMTKNDYVIISDEVNLEGLEKLKNIIILTKNKDYDRTIYSFVRDNAGEVQLQSRLDDFRFPEPVQQNKR